MSGWERESSSKLIELRTAGEIRVLRGERERLDQQRRTERTTTRSWTHLPTERRRSPRDHGSRSLFPDLDELERFDGFELVVRVGVALGGELGEERISGGPSRLGVVFGEGSEELRGEGGLGWSDGGFEGGGKRESKSGGIIL